MASEPPPPLPPPVVNKPRQLTAPPNDVKPHKDPKGPLYVNAARPEGVAPRKRTPKVVQKGLEAAFRKRQNLKLREEKERVLELFGQVMDKPLQSTEELRTLFRSVNEELSALGLSLGGSENWADRLYIEDKRGGCLFNDAELDLAELAQASTLLCIALPLPLSCCMPVTPCQTHCFCPVLRLTSSSL